MRPILCLVFAIVACAPEGTQDDAPCSNAFFTDLDGDGHGDPLGDVTSACEVPEGFAVLGDDCDDTTPAVYGGADEICDALDNDCDELVDEDAVDALVWYADTDGDLYGDSSAPLTGTCGRPAGYAEVGGDCDDTKFAVNPGQVELCNGFDDDCDELVDTDDASLVGGDVWYEDADFDHFGDAATGAFSCDQPDGWVDNGLDCDDGNVHVHPGNPETCDDLDNDCDELTDDDDPDLQGEVEIYADTDGDTLGDPDAVRSACALLDGYVQNTDDCDDTTAEIGEALWYYLDRDGDGYGFGAAYEECSPGTGDAPLDGDCDPTEETAYPGAPEICDNHDNDCNGLRDEDDPGLVYTVWYADSDRDGYGTSSDTVESCEHTAGYVLTSGDCDDDEASANPAGIEWCDSIDNDCNALVDDAVVTIDWYADADRDGYGDPTDVTTDCVQPRGHTSTAGDCDDADADISPDAPDTCGSGVDEDCDGATDNCRVDLEAADLRFAGTDDGGELGTALATGDLDADGIADLVTGAPGELIGGRIRMHYGSPVGVASIALHSARAKFGRELATGDADGDGFDDLVVGAPRAEEAYVFLGPITANRRAKRAQAIWTDPGSTGSSIAVVADVDGDAVPDVLVGAPDAGSSGSAFVISGASSGSASLSATATYEYDGPGGDTRTFGSASASLGDVDGDGLADFAVAACTPGDGGVVYVLLGGAAPGTYDAASEASATIEGASGGAFGEAMTVTDYDGDGAADLFVGDEYADASGAVYGFLGPLSGSLVTGDAQVEWLSGSTDVLGLAEVAAGDVDADGRSDLLLGAARSLDSQGLVFLQLGFVSGVADVDALPSFYSSSGDRELLGSSLLLLPDLDGDGGDEIAIGAPVGQDERGYDTGRAYVLFSSFLP